MARDLGCWLVSDAGDFKRLDEDPQDEYYFEPRSMPEKLPGKPTEMFSVKDAYRRYQLRDGPATMGVVYARRELTGSDKARLLETMYGNYGRD
jgi:hypothetical protein